MSKPAAPQYTKLRGLRARGAGQRFQVWMAPDHFLVSASAYGFETYRRYFFRDLQAFIIRPNSRRLVGNIIMLGVLTLLVGAAAWLTATTDFHSRSDRVGPLILLGTIAFLVVTLGVSLLVNSLAGQGCAVHVQTVAGLDRLGAPTRVAGAQRLLGLLLAQTAAPGSPPEPVRAEPALPEPLP